MLYYQPLQVAPKQKSRTTIPQTNVAMGHRLIFYFVLLTNCYMCIKTQLVSRNSCSPPDQILPTTFHYHTCAKVCSTAHNCTLATCHLNPPQKNETVLWMPPLYAPSC